MITETIEIGDTVKILLKIPFERFIFLKILKQAVADEANLIMTHKEGYFLIKATENKEK